MPRVKKTTVTDVPPNTPNPEESSEFKQSLPITLDTLTDKKYKTDSESDDDKYDEKTVSVHNEQSTTNKISYRIDEEKYHKLNTDVFSTYSDDDLACVLFVRFRKSKNHLTKPVLEIHRDCVNSSFGLTQHSNINKKDYYAPNFKTYNNETTVNSHYGHRHDHNNSDRDRDRGREHYTGRGRGRGRGHFSGHFSGHNRGGFGFNSNTDVHHTHGNSYNSYDNNKKDYTNNNTPNSNNELSTNSDYNEYSRKSKFETVIKPRGSGSGSNFNSRQNM
jgi:hypothetical protein